MNIKNFNPFERHVEKITLAVAAAGAAYLIWMAYPPILSIDGPGGQQIEAGQVEPAVTAAVAQLEAARDRTLQRGEIQVRLPDVVGKYKLAMMGAPLSEELVSARVPPIGPLNVAVGEVGHGPQDTEQPVATPEVPAPTDLSAKTWMGRVVYVPPPPPGAAPAAPGAAPQAELADVRLNLIRGTVDRGAMLAEMQNPDIPPDQRIPVALQQAVVCRIEVQRREQTASGWQDWVDVNPDSALPRVPEVPWNNGDEDILPNLTFLAQHAPEILKPDYFHLPNGQTVVQDIDSENQPATPPGTTVPPAPGTPAPAAPQSLPMINGQPLPAPSPEAPRFNPGRSPTGFTPGRSTSRFTPGRSTSGFTPGRDAGGFGPAVAPAAPAPGAQLPDKAPFWFFDDSVKPGRTYEYQVRVVMYNPTYRLPHKLKDPPMRQTPTIASAWTPVPGSVSVEGDMYVYVTGGAGGAANNPQQRIGVRIYKWSAGYWYSHEITTEPGLQIATRMILGGPKTPETVVNTGLTMVDLRENNDVVVLQNADGDLETRDYRIDSSDGNKKKLDLAVAKHAAEIASTQPAPVRPPVVRPRPTPEAPPDEPRAPSGGRSRFTPGRSVGGQ